MMIRKDNENISIIVASGNIVDAGEEMRRAVTPGSLTGILIGGSQSGARLVECPNT